MSPQLIVMLTRNDQTVKNAIEVFQECRDLPVTHWGFKDIGLPEREMKRLVREIRAAGKSPVLEVVSYREDECLSAARLAVECEFDYLMGTVFYKSVFTMIKSAPIKYFPFCGSVSGHPSVLEGSILDIVAEAKRLQETGVDGFDLLAYRYRGDAEELARQFIAGVRVPVVLAGSINDFGRLDAVKRLGPWGFTIGGAFFDGAFKKGGSFREQIQTVLHYLAK